MLDPEDIAKVEGCSGEGVWWVRWVCLYGHEHKEKIGVAKGLARSFYEKRKLATLNPIKYLWTSGSATDRCWGRSGRSWIMPTTTSTRSATCDNIAERVPCTYIASH